MHDHSELWAQVASKVGSKASYCRFYYMDCYTRSSFKDSMRQNNRTVDQFILKKIQENLPKWKIMSSKQRLFFIR